MKVHGGKELVTESPIRVRASSFPLRGFFVFTRAHKQNESCSSVCTYELVHAFVFYGGTRCVFTYMPGLVYQ